MLNKIKLYLYLKHNGAGNIIHKRPRSLMEHLMGTFELLRLNEFDDEICLAGGLHSIYGTSVFQTMMFEPSDERRAEVRRIFGHRTEKLSYLFHVANRPADLNNFKLRNRFNGDAIDDVSEDEVFDLCIIEAANFIEQSEKDILERKYPKVYVAWMTSIAKLRRFQVVHKPNSLFRSKGNDMTRTNCLNSRLCQMSNSCISRVPGLSCRTQSIIPVSEQSIRLRIFPSCTHYLTDEKTVRHNSSSVDMTVSFNIFFYAPEQMREDSTKNEYFAFRTRVFTLFQLPDEHWDKTYLTFCLYLEDHYGMPPLPMALLASFGSMSCCVPTRLLKNPFLQCVVPLEITVQLTVYSTAIDSMTASYCIPRSLKTSSGAIPLTLLWPFCNSEDESKPSKDSCVRARQCLFDSLRSQGWAVVKVPASHVDVIQRAYTVILHFIQNLHFQRKREFFHRFDGMRYVGYAQDNGREWLQLRSRCSDISWPLVPELDTWLHRMHEKPTDKTPIPDDELEQRQRGLLESGLMLSKFDASSVGVVDVSSTGFCKKSLVDSTELLEVVSRELWQCVGESLGMDADYVKGLPDDTKSNFGASVHRLFVYKDRNPASGQGQGQGGSYSGGLASGNHSDMGLLTVAPRSTHPALELVNPYSQEVMNPEDDLAEDEWLVFSGETLSFLSGGLFRAPLHRVPWVNRAANEPRRCSMPFFLRAGPSAELIPLDRQFDNKDPHFTTPLLFSPSSLPSMTCRRFMLSHSLGARPYRPFQVSGGGDF